MKKSMKWNDNLDENNNPEPIDYYLELANPDDADEKIKELSAIFGKTGVILEMTKNEENRSFLHCSVALDKLRRRAGRKKSPERSNRLDIFCKLKGEDQPMGIIMEKLDISQATYYRYLNAYKDRMDELMKKREE